MKKSLILVILFLAAFSVRLIFALNADDVIETDELEYDRLATCLLESKGYIDSGEGHLTSLRPPLYPAFLALIYGWFGRSIFTVFLIQAFIGSLTVCLFYLIADRVFNKTTAIFTGIFSVFYMTFVACGNLLYTETLFTFLLALIIYLAVASNKFGLLKFCIIGFLCGLLTLLRSAGLGMPFLIILFLIARAPKKYGLSPKKIAIYSLALIVSCATIILPWTIRNYRVHNKFVLISSNAGINMYVAVRPAFGKIIGLGPQEDEVAEESLTISNEAERNDFYIKEALKAYRESPADAFRAFILRFLFFWNVIDWEIISGEIINYHFIFIFPFAVLGTAISLKTRKEILFILLVILYFTAQTLLFQGTPRYRMPIDGYLIMLGCYGIYWLVFSRRKKIYPALCISAYFLFTYGLYIYSPHVKGLLSGLMKNVGIW